VRPHRRTKETIPIVDVISPYHSFTLEGGLERCGLPVIQAKPREARPTANVHGPNRVSSFYPGVLIPFLSISMAFPNRFNRVSSFLASAIQRQYSLRWV
jgi:hypothetical protein